MRVFRTSSGFTLIELSIVLVIIGLIIGGILVGRDLIKTAEIRATIAQNEEFNTAVNAFRTKFNCLPGDCVSAVEFGFDPTTVGNGDGRIGVGTGVWANGSVIHESIDFWNNLSAAGLISGNFRTYSIVQPESSSCGCALPIAAGNASPKAKISSPYPISVMGKSFPYGWGVKAEIMLGAFGADGTIPSHNLLLASIAQTNIMDGGTFGGFAPADIAAIDVKIDDGIPLTGRAYAWTNSAGFPIATYSVSYGAGGQNSPVCVRDDIDPPQYNVQYNGSNRNGHCKLAIKATF